VKLHHLNHGSEPDTRFLAGIAENFNQKTKIADHDQDIILYSNMPDEPISANDYKMHAQQHFSTKSNANKEKLLFEIFDIFNL